MSVLANVMLAGIVAGGVPACLHSPRKPVDADAAPVAGDGRVLWQLPTTVVLQLALDTERGPVLAGGFFGSLDLFERHLEGDGSLDVVLAGLTPAGETRYVRSYGGAGDEGVEAVAVDPLTGDVAVSGQYVGDGTVGGEVFPNVPRDTTAYGAFVADYTPEGLFAWSQPITSVTSGGAALASRNLSFNGLDELLCTGTYSPDLTSGGQTLSTTGGGYDGFALLATPSGAVSSLADVGGAGSEVMAGALADGLGEQYLFGQYTGDTTIFGRSLASTSTSLMVARVDYASTQATWARGIGVLDATTVEASASAVIGGDLLITAIFEGHLTLDGVGGPISLDSAGDHDALIARLASGDGKVVWARQIGGKGDDRPEGIAAGAGGRIAVTGFFNGTAAAGDQEITSAGGSDVFLAEYESDGTLVRIRRFGDAGDDSGLGVAVDPSGSVYLTVSYRGMIDFGGPDGPLTSTLSQDGAAARFE